MASFATASAGALATLSKKLSSPGSISDWAKSNFPAAPTQPNTTWYQNPTIAWSNWNQFQPIQLMVVDNINGTYVQRIVDGNWSFTFPVGLEALSISTPFASTNYVTLGGDITESNGAPVRMLSLQGTFGVLFGKQPGPPAPAVSFLNSIFAGTLTNLNNTISAGQSIANLGAPPNFKTNVIQQDTFQDTTQNALITGYSQARLLQAFFENFNELKKSKAGRNSRLALALWKNEAIYLCTPIDYTCSQSASSPLEYLFSLQLKATKRVKLSGSSAGAVTPFIPIQNSPSKMARLMNTIQAVRTTLQSAKKTILAFGGDVNASLFTPLRELTLVAKDALSVPFAVADMANNVIDSMKGAIIDLASTKNAITNFQGNIQKAYGTVTQNAKTITFNLNSLAAEQGDTSDIVPGFAAAPANNPFLDPVSNYDFFSGVNIGDLNLPPTVLSSVAAERQRIRNLTRLDFETRRNAIKQVSDNYANAVGLGSAAYNAVYGLTTPSIVNATPTDDDFNVLFALNDLITSINALVVSTTTNTSTKQDTIATIAGMATASGIAFTVPTSKFAVPFPYGSTIENLAYKYLGDPDRALEIITLNGLQSPFVDEEGFELPLLSNGVNNNLFVDNNDNLYIGQPVWISSTTTPRIQTRIEGVRLLNNNQTMVTVRDDVSLYTTTAKAVLLAYLPNTVNSQQTIYIPSSVEPQQNDLTIKAIPGIDQFDPLLTVGGIDFLLTPTNDIVLNSSGDTKWAVGLTNLINWVKLALGTRRGALNRHPEYGLDLQPGTSLADLSASQIVQSIQSMVADNSAFTGIAASQVSINGPVADLDIAFTIAGTDNQILPLSAQVVR
jgi:hypothetical protein